MIQETISEQIKRAATLFKQSKYAVAFSGAGISTDSGIPDFRSPDSGLWKDADPLSVASIYGFKHNPQAFYDWVRPLARLTLNAQPNAAHLALVQLEKLNYLQSIITQNIDMLHTKAGSSCVYELHGHMREATCIKCFHIQKAQPLFEDFLNNGNIPQCSECGGVVKPNVILFGEQLPIRELQAAQDATRKCDLMLIVGSSLEVAPASDIPILASRTGARLIVVNLEPTPADRVADVVIHARAADILPEIAHQVEAML